MDRGIEGGGPAAALLGALLALTVAAPRASAQGPCADAPVTPQNEARCRRKPPQWPVLRFGLEPVLGGLWSDAPLNDLTVGVGLPVDLFISETFALGARLSWQMAADQARDADGDGADDRDEADHHALLVLGGPRLVLYTERARREAWRFEANAGFMAGVGGDARSGPVVELAVGRQAGSLTVADRWDAHGTGWDVALTLRLQQGLGAAADYRALLLAGTIATELGVPLPRGPRPRRVRPGVEYTFGADGGAALALFGKTSSLVGGGGLFFGLPLGSVLEPRLRLELFHVAGPGARDGSDFVAVFGGLRLGRWFPMFLEVLGGWGATLGLSPGLFEDTGLLEITAGFQIPNVFGCGLGFYGGPQAHIGMARTGRDGGGLFTLGAVVGLSYDNLVRAAECSP